MTTRDLISDDWLGILEGAKRYGFLAFIGFAPVVIVVVFSFFVDAGSENPEEAVSRFTSILKRLPTQTPLYICVALLVGARLATRRWQYIELVNEFTNAKNEEDDERSLTPRDWWVVQELRKRALGLRMRADILLISVLAMLFGGMYFVLFVLFEVEQSEIFLVRRAQFEERFGQTLEFLAEGRYWIKSDDVPTRQAFDLVRSEEGLMEMALGDKNLVFLTTDGRKTWLPTSLPLRDGEWVDELAVSADGRTIVAAGSEGSLLMSREEGKSWPAASLPLRDGEQVDALAVSADGRTIVAAGDRGTLLMTRDEGKSWPPTSIPMRDGGQVHALAVSADGRTIVAAGDRGALLTNREDGKSWNPFQTLGIGTLYKVSISDDSRVVVAAVERASSYMTKNGGTLSANMTETPGPL